MMHVYWLQQCEADIPATDDWLCAREALLVDGMRFARRRADWRLGRWTAKRALAIYLALPDHPHALASIEIRQAESGAPRPFLADRPAPVSISLTHRAGIAVCSIALQGVALGCDLELIEPREDNFVADYFTKEEQALVARTCPKNRDQVVTLVWSAKESALKALGKGLQLDTRSVVVSFEDVHTEDMPNAGKGSPLPPSDGDTWQPLAICHLDGRLFHGWWKVSGPFLQTLVSDSQPSRPTMLNVTTGVKPTISLQKA